MSQQSHYAEGIAAGLMYAEPAQGQVYVSFNNTGTATTQWDPIVSRIEAKQSPGISPQLYFKYIKNKFGVIEKTKFEARLKRLEKSFNYAMEAGQVQLGEKLMNEVSRITRESAMYAKGFRIFIERDDLWKHKRNIRDGHISDTRLENFTRMIPEEVKEKIQESHGLFDGYVVYHYWNEDAMRDPKLKGAMNEEEKAKMRDPVVFGWIRECDRLYYVADWEDEYCAITIEDILDAVEKEGKLTKDVEVL